MTNSQAERVLVATILAAHSIHGAVTAESKSDNPQRFVPGTVFHTEQGQILHLQKASTHKGRLLLTFEESPDRNAAEKLRGCNLYVPADQVPPLPEGNWYVFELVGLTVREAGKDIGKITEVLSYPANDIYVMERAEGGQVLIPALRSVVRRVDVAAGIMEVELPEGL